MSKLLIVVALVLIIGGAIYFEYRRGNSMKAAAERLGFSFHPGQHLISEPLKRAEFDLFSQGEPNIKNRMEGERDGDRISVFDFSYPARTAGEGERGTPLSDDHQGMETRSQSVIWVQGKPALPDFDLSPSRIHDRTVAVRLGLQRLTFDGSTQFNDRYVLLARDDGRVRPLFTPEVQEYLLAHPGLVFESRGEDALFYRFGQRVDPKGVPLFLDEVQALLGLIREEFLPGR